MKETVGKVAKAVFAALFTGLSTLGALLVNDTSLSSITAGQWVYVATAGLLAGGGVFGIKNTV